MNITSTLLLQSGFAKKTYVKSNVYYQKGSCILVPFGGFWIICRDMENGIITSEAFPWISTADELNRYCNETLKVE